MLCLLYCTQHFHSTVPAAVDVISIFLYLVWSSYKNSVNCNNYKVLVCSTVSSRSLLHSYKHSSTPLRRQQCLLKRRSTFPTLLGVISHILPRARGENLRSYNIAIRSKCQYGGRISTRVYTS